MRNDRRDEKIEWFYLKKFFVLNVKLGTLSPAGPQSGRKGGEGREGGGGG